MKYDSATVAFLEIVSIRDTFVEIIWEAAESDFEAFMVTNDAVKVGWLSDVIFFAENDVLIIDAVDLNDVEAFCCKVDAFESSLL